MASRFPLLSSWSGCLLPVWIVFLVFGSAPLQARAAVDPSAAGRSKKAPEPAPDTLVFTNGDRLSGKFERAVGDQILFHSDIVGDVTVKWDKVKELHTGTRLVVLEKSAFLRHGHLPPGVPQGTLSVDHQLITVQPENGATIAPIPVKNAEYIVDETILKKQIAGHPGALAGWNGSATAGATIVQATEEQYTFSGGLSLARVAPTVTWLNTNNRTLLDFSGSFGKIIQPAYMSDGVFTPASASKTSIYHADAERDEYFSPRFYVLAQTVFDHNFAQTLELQQIYGAGIGWTAIKRPSQELDVKTTLQYEGQNFLDATPGENQNLIGSTLDANWASKLPHKIIFKQEISWIPAYNNPYAYSAGETNSLIMPFFKNLAFSVGSIDSYLNDPPAAVPPTKQNSLQFTTGFTYAIKSKY